VQTTHRFSGDDCSVLPVVDEDIPVLETLLDRLSIYARSTRSGFLHDRLLWNQAVPPEANA
jgi:hypothetical protein